VTLFKANKSCVVVRFRVRCRMLVQRRWFSVLEILTQDQIENKI